MPSIGRVGAAVIAVIAVTLVLSGCAGSPIGKLFNPSGRAPGQASGSGGAHSGQDDETGDGITIADLRPKPAATAATYYGQHIAWKPCHRVLRCGTVRVPIDWQHVTGDSIVLALVEHPAGGTRVGALVVNPGGPGGSGVEFVEGGVEGVVDPTVAKRFDIVGFDPRGVGASAPVTCYNDAGTDTYNYAIDPGPIGSAKWIAAEMKKSRDLAAACAKNTGPVLGHIDSINAATDLEVIRTALGEPKLNFLGYSYGSYLGTLYAGLFPSRVGRFVLDGAEDPWGEGYQPTGPNDEPATSDDFSVDPADDSTVAQAQSFEDSFSSYLESCLANDPDTVGDLRCPFVGSLAKVQRRTQAILASVNAHPIRARDGRLLGGATLVTAIDDSLYDPLDWPDLTKMFVQLAAGNPAQAFAFADEYNDRNSDGSYADNNDFAHLAIGCVESGSDVDLRYDKREAAELKLVAPVLGIYAAYGDLVCSGWKFPVAPFPNTIHAKGTGPIIVVGTTGDPATPYSDAKLLAKQLDNGHLVTYEGDGHTAYNRGDACIDATIDDYLIDGTVSRDPDCT